jgi:cell division septal protein FtsQ
MTLRTGYGRLERDAHQRRARANAHLERVRSRRHAAPRPGVSRRALGVALLAGFGVGALWGDALLGTAGDESDGAQRGIGRIAVRGNRHLSPQEVAAASGVAPGAAIASVEPQAVEAQLEDHEWIASARVVRMPGNTLLVGVVERIALAGIELGTPPRPYAVDATGAPFAAADRETLAGLPRLAAAESVRPHQASARLADAVSLAYRLPEIGLALPTEVSIGAEGDPEGFALRFASLAPRFVLGREDLDERLEQLASLLARQPDAVTQASSVDLRFADQVVLRTEPTPRGAAPALGGHPAPLNRKPAG